MRDTSFVATGGAGVLASVAAVDVCVMGVRMIGVSVGSRGASFVDSASKNGKNARSCWSGSAVRNASPSPMMVAGVLTVDVCVVR